MPAIMYQSGILYSTHWFPCRIPAFWCHSMRCVLQARHPLLCAMHPYRKFFSVSCTSIYWIHKQLSCGH